MRDRGNVRIILAACCAALLAACSGAPAAENPKPPTPTTTTSTADPALCREVAKGGKDLLKIVYEEDGDALILDWIHAADDVIDIDERLATQATPTLRDEVWELIDAAELIVADDWEGDDELKPLIDDLASAMVDVNDQCEEAGYSLQR